MVEIDDLSSALFWLLDRIGKTLETEEDLKIAKFFFNEALLVLKHVASKDLRRIVKEFIHIKNKNEYDSFSEKWFQEDVFNYKTSGLNRWVNWIDCHSDNKAKRRGPCGTWKLLHVMSIYGPQKSTDFSNAADYSSLISDFVSRHFPCSGCRKDFRQRIGKTRESDKLEIIIRDPTNIKNNEDLIIWLWKIHNDVNETLMREPGLDSTQFGDVEHFPKRIWPDRNATEEEIVAILRKEYEI